MTCPSGFLVILEQIECHVNSCSSPPSAPEFGDVSFSHGNDHASVALFQCNNGYTMNGQAAMTCDAAIDGNMWPSETPDCVVNTCTSPPMNGPDGGYVTFSSGNDHGSMASIGCHPGHVQSGGTLVTCDATTDLAAWPVFEDPPVCSAVICGVSEHVINHLCIPCPEGENNTAGDDASGANTVCDGPLTDTFVVQITLHDVFSFNDVEQNALNDAISLVFAEQGVVADVSMDNITMTWNSTSGDFTADFIIAVQSDSETDPAEAVATNFVGSMEFTDALSAEFEEAELGFVITPGDTKVIAEAITAAEEEGTSAETVVMVILIVVVFGMVGVLAKLICFPKANKNFSTDIPMGRVNVMQKNAYQAANTSSQAAMASETSMLTGSSSSQAHLTSQSSFQM